MKKLTPTIGMEKSRKVKQVLGVLFVLVCVILCTHQILALGVAPSRETIDYQQGKQTITARIINNDHEAMRVALYPKGDLANYTTMAQDIISIKADEQEKSFTYTIDLPAGLRPGALQLGIIIVQLPETFSDSKDNLVATDEKAILFNKKDQNSMISATTAVVQQLTVNVPYPDSYVEGNLFITEGKVGDQITFTMPLLNKGLQPADVYADITIKGPSNEDIATLKTDKTSLGPSKETSLATSWKADVNQGIYYAEVVVHYGDTYFTQRKEFSVGNLFIAVDGLSVQGFKLGGIAKFDVAIKNKWNEDIKDIYGELNVIDANGKSISNLKTLNTNIAAYGDGTLNGFWDTTGVNVGRYDVNVVLHYSGKTTEKLFQTAVGIDTITVADTSSGKVTGSKETTGGSTSLLSILLIVVIILIAINIGWFVFFRRKAKKPPEIKVGP